MAMHIMEDAMEKLREASRSTMSQSRSCKGKIHPRYIAFLTSKRSVQLHTLTHEFGELLYVIGGRIPGAHPAHHRLSFIPDIKEVPLLQFRDSFPGDLRKDPVRFHVVGDLHLPNVAYLAFQ